MKSSCNSHYLVCNTTCSPLCSICSASMWLLASSHRHHATSIYRLQLILKFWHVPQVKNPSLGSAGKSVERLSMSNHSYTLQVRGDNRLSRRISNSAMQQSRYYLESGSLAAAHKPQQLRMRLLLRSLEQAVFVQSLRSCSVAYLSGHCRHCHSQWGQEVVEDLPLRPICKTSFCC